MTNSPRVRGLSCATICMVLGMLAVLSSTTSAQRHFRRLSPIDSQGWTRSTESQQDEADPQLAVNLEFADQPLHLILLQMFFSPAKFKIYGDPNLPVTASLRAHTIDDAIQMFSEQTGILATRRGALHIFYSIGAEAELQRAGIDKINYMFRCRHARAADIVGLIDGREAEGFPKPRGLPESQSGAAGGFRGAAGDFGGDFGGGGFDGGGFDGGVVRYQNAGLPPDEFEPGMDPMMPPPGAAGGKGLRNPLGTAEYQVVSYLNSILLRGSLEEVRKAIDFLMVLDHPQPVVLIELLIVQYLHRDQYTWRYDLFNGQLAAGDPPRANQVNELLGTSLYDIAQGMGFGQADPFAGTYPLGPRDWGINAEQIGLSAVAGGGPLSFTTVGALTAHFRQNIQWLIANDMARVVTNPHVAVVSGTEGAIRLEDVANFASTTLTPLGVQETGQPQSLISTTSLNVTPTIVSTDNIHLAINSRLDVFTEQTNVGTINVQGGQGVTNLPDQRKSSIATAVVLSENETVIIGGLVKEEMIESTSKIPFLNKIPLLGHAFKARADERIYTETVIYITPHISRSQNQEDDYYTQAFDKMERLQQRGQQIAEQHRMDKYRSRDLEKFNERIEHNEYANHRKKWWHRFKRQPDCSCGYCNGHPSQANESGDNATDPNAEELEELPASNSP